MKYFILLCLILLIGGMLYWRMRPYIMIARRVVAALRNAQHIRGPAGGTTTSIPRRDAPAGRVPRRAAAEKLVRCATCQTWLPASRAVALRSSTISYCSHACLERSADDSQRAHKSAS